MATPQNASTKPDAEWASIRAFTLLELCVAIVVAGLIILIALPGFAHGKERSAQAGCLNNLRRMGAGSAMYAQDDSLGRLTGSLASTPQTLLADDDLNWLHGFFGGSPTYISDLQTFCCPSTCNNVDSNKFTTVLFNGQVCKLLVDLKSKASPPAWNPTSNAATNGHSYEVCGSWHNSNHPVLGAYPRKTARLSMTYQNANAPHAGEVPGPAKIVIIFDQMEPHTAQGWFYENWPNPYNNHGMDGGNAAYADGHASWTGVGSWREMMSRSEDYAPSWSFPPGY